MFINICVQYIHKIKTPCLCQMGIEVVVLGRESYLDTICTVLSIPTPLLRYRGGGRGRESVSGGSMCREGQEGGGVVG